MKFGKKFVSEMVSEWQNAYMEYDHLKTFLKEILREKQRSSSRQPEGLSRAIRLYRAFSGLVQRHNHVTSRNASAKTDDIEHQAILATSIERDGSEIYETLFLMAADDGGELELVFFNKLGHEFNKVDRFYKSTVREVVSEAEMLGKQMDMLIAFRVKVDNFEELLPNDSGEMLHETKPTTPVAPVEILNNVKLNKILDTPLSVIEGCLDPSNQAEPNFSRKNLKKAERQLKQVFIEFYHKLQLLKNYRHLNMSAFSKIMKKYDKITSRNTSRTYMNIVDKSYLGRSDEVPKLLQRVEATYIKHFSKSNREKAMDTLRPKAKRERHRETFFMGLFVGCTFALVLSLVLIIRARGILNRKGQAQYMDNMFPLYSLFAFIVLHMVIYAANMYFWRRYRINYPFIFGVKQGTELGYREVLLVSFGLAVLALASVLSNLDMEMDPKTNEYKALTELVPLGLVALVILVLFCPLNIIYRSSRYFLVTSLFHCICAPLYKVTFHDSFIIDQLTSQVQAFRSLEFYICYYGWGDYKLRQHTCKTSDVYNTFYFIIAVIPYWSRLLQCLRRLYEEKDKMQGYNGLKYFITILAVCTRTAYSLDKGILRKTVAAIFSGSAAIYCTYWDLVIDWGLLQSPSKNRFLRDKLLIPYKGVYFGAMVLDVLLRFAWLQTVLDFQVSFLHRQTLISIVASLEIIRRGLWNFFRLENEHLHNVGNYRAFKFIPLPFELDVGADEQQK